MNRLLALIAIATLAACDTGLVNTSAGPDPSFVVAGKRAKSLVCHVGSETGPAGEVYDPACIPGDGNGWFCADAGKIDLIDVSSVANHLGNPAHAFGGIVDYDPFSAGASGVGNEDSDGDGIDDGCEIDPVCPCWDESELNAITEANLSPDACSGYVSIGGSARAIFSNDDLFPVGFVADPFGEGIGPWCGLLYPVETNQQVSTAEAETCVAQIEARCAEIEGDGPIVLGRSPSGRTRR